MKKILALLVAISVILALAGCSGAFTETSADIDDYDELSDALNIVSETTSKEVSSSSNNAEWKQFIKDYDAWVDRYIKIVKKYKANPGDISILTDYTKMVSEMTEWTQRSEKLEEELDTTDALEFAAELAKIAQKLAEVAN